jgi:hypothetical protein
MDSPSAEGLEETGASRPGELINSLREGLLACPLEALMKILPEGFSSAPGVGSPRELAEAILGGTTGKLPRVKSLWRPRLLRCSSG